MIFGWRPGHQLRRYLLAWTLLPIAGFMVLDGLSLYHATQRATEAAHDRLLEATARQIGDLIHIEREQLSIRVPLAMIEALEGAGGSRMYYRVLDFAGRSLAGDDALPLPADDTALQKHYLAEVDRQPVRVVALRQPIEMSQGRGVAIILVAETLEARRQQAATLLQGMLLRQGLLMGVIAIVVWLAVDRGLRPLQALRRELRERRASQASAVPLHSRGPEELQPVIDEMNALLARQHDLLEQQSRFVADASHQLRTPMAVLKTQLQSAQDGESLAALAGTVDRVTRLADQLLNKARLEHSDARQAHEPLAMDAIAREVVLAMSPLLAQRHLAFSLDGDDVPTVRGDRWMAGELIANLLSNAIRHTPHGQALGIRFARAAGGLTMTVWDSGPGIAEAARQALFRPFAAGSSGGAGLGLSICLDIAGAMNASIALDNRLGPAGEVLGLDAQVRWT
ncbi:sensor histidine kinase [Pseudorhodoferax sp.]|uniref:sensor histidine kinase n=1 Tax=Pseudorhodoferax sp. TaxID=1993553 RepID=UPI002DD65600|nr:sensor histidine kinase N-terminal domain-containing protein [Pseudorhodoferax sp.]